jgi:NAD(P)-dependent dehydrogenase (short-subunit alcohol dehydrogenase family)
MISKGWLCVIIVLAVPVLVAFLWTRLPFLPRKMALARAQQLNAPANFIGRNAIVVGGTSGIGMGIAVRLAAANYSVTLVGRNADRAKEIIEEMTKKGGKQHEFVSCDAQHIRNLREMARSYAEKHSTLDVLVQTQGIATTQGRTETQEGLDQKMAIHYYGRMALINAFLPLLRSTAASEPPAAPKVLSVLSAGVHGVYQNYATDPELRDNYSLKNAADAAGFYNDLCLDSFAKQPENKGITFIHAAPGIVNTNWGTELNFVLRGLVRLVQPLATSTEECAEYMCLPILSPSSCPDYTPEGSVVLIGAKGDPAKKSDRHEEARETIWKHTQDVLDKIN